MLANQLKGLLTSCPDKTDLPTRGMVWAGAKAILEQTIGGAEYGTVLDHAEAKDLAEAVWNAMLAALRRDGHIQPKDCEEEP